ncbi:MAG: HD domain-containing protein [Planctomycetaceae bacterium]|jgi:HD superfamily phosphohydrolase|nr:HD domain-containing protein [Planctomycetaceae bacterium]
MNYFESENLSQDPIHGYIPFSASLGTDEISERDIIDSPWVQRLRQIHQLQTAWLVYPTAEHTRFQHSLGAMHLASRTLAQFYRSLLDVCRSVGETLPSRNYLESLTRMAALLHDVGHGPFGHFFDVRFLSEFGLNHEKLGAEIIRQRLAPMLRKIRRNPLGQLEENETLDPEQIAFLIVRPTTTQELSVPLWLRLLRTLFCGLYTVDNMDFVLRDAFMTGFSERAFDLDRLLHYSFFTKEGLTVHPRGTATLIRFLTVRAELFRSIYFHRTVRAIDLFLHELFLECRELLFPGSGGEGSRNPLENLDAYLHFTEWSLLVDVSRWDRSPNQEKRKLATKWSDFLARRVPFHLAAETTALFFAGQREQTSIFADTEAFRLAIITCLPESLRSIPFEVDIARHLHRPDSHRRTITQNFLYDSVTDRIRTLDEEELFRHIPQSYRICRIYTKEKDHIIPLAKALEALTKNTNSDDETNM